MKFRLGVTAAVVLALVALVQIDDPHPFVSGSTAEKAAATAAKMSAVIDDSAVSTWYCSAAGAGTATQPTHQIIITNNGDATTARVTGYRSTSNKVAVIAVDLPASSQTVVVATDIAPDVLGASVEIHGSGGSVAHRLVSSTASDQSDCMTRASTEWHFPSATTETGFTSRLWLLNPFPTDASVDVSIVTDDGVRVPKSLSGLIVPAGSSRSVDIGDAGQKRAQFAATVQSRGGRVFAELAQTSPASKTTGGGLRLQPGIGATETRWLFADSFGGANVTDQLVVYNPGEFDASVAVSVFPDGYDKESLPEPFVLEVPARRYSVVKLSDEARVSPDVRRWIQVDSLEKSSRTVGVVAVEIVGVVGEGGDGSIDTRPSVAGGLASSTGSPLRATTWIVSSIDASKSDGQSAAIVVNPSDSIALITVSTVSGGKKSAVSDKPLEVPPRSALPIDVSDAADGPTMSLIISSPTPIVVAARETSNKLKDLAMWPALPSTDGALALRPQN